MSSKGSKSVELDQFLVSVLIPFLRIELRYIIDGRELKCVKLTGTEFINEQKRGESSVVVSKFIKEELPRYGFPGFARKGKETNTVATDSAGWQTEIPLSDGKSTKVLVIHGSITLLHSRR